MSYNPAFPSPSPGHHQQGFPPQQGYPGAPPPQQGYGQPGGFPPQGPSQGQPASGVQNITTSLSIDGCSFTISHRDSNSVLSARLPAGYELKGKPGAMVAMDGSVKIKGKLKLSFKKFITGSDLAESTFTGPGEVLLAPETWGDIVPIHLNGNETWFFSKHAFLACTHEVVRAHKAQSLGKTLFSGEGLFVEQASGRGVIFVSSLGAIIERQLRDSEQWIVDNGHLVAWTAKYSVERIQAGGLLSAAKTDEGLVCRFTGPGKVYLQSRNPDVLVEWIRDQLPSSN